MLQHVAVCCSVLQCVPVCCAIYTGNVAADICCCGGLGRGDVALLQCVAVCCSVLQCVAVCCSVLYYVAVVD